MVMSKICNVYYNFPKLRTKLLSNFVKKKFLFYYYIISRLSKKKEHVRTSGSFSMTSTKTGTF